MKKYITNQTNFDITVTLYVANPTESGFNTEEMHTVDISAQQYKDIAYEGFNDSFISGIDVCAEKDGTHLNFSQKAGTSDAPFSKEANEKHFIDIKGFRSLDIEFL